MSIQEKIDESKNHAVIFSPGDFDPKCHFIAKTLCSKLNKTGKGFFNLSNKHIIERFCALNPSVSRAVLTDCLSYQAKYFKWAGCDLFNVTDAEGKRKMIIIENNTCATGIESMPGLTDENKYASYTRLVGTLYDTQISKIDSSLGDLAVVYDINSVEASGYCAYLAELSQETVWLVEYLIDLDVADKENCSKNVKWLDGFMYVRDKFDKWHKIRACMRQVTQKPWAKIPVNTKTLVINPIVACLAGGRNKALANYAYDRFNNELEQKASNLRIRKPYGVNVSKNEIPHLIENDPNFDGKGVIKVPYSNCGQGVYTIVNKRELDDFMREKHCYDTFILQSLVGNEKWFTQKKMPGQYFQIGTKPNEKNEKFVYDMRLTMTTNKEGFMPVSIHFRIARKPLVDDVNEVKSSWELLGTNLSVKLGENLWDVEEDRLMCFDDEFFEQTQLDEDDLIDSYVQTVLSTIAIDKICIELHDENGRFDLERFKHINTDYSLLDEIRI